MPMTQQIGHNKHDNTNEKSANTTKRTDTRAMAQILWHDAFTTNNDQNHNKQHINASNNICIKFIIATIPCTNHIVHVNKQTSTTLLTLFCAAKQIVAAAARTNLSTA